MLAHLDRYFEDLGARRRLILALLFSCVLGVANYYIGPDLSFSVFYTAPIMLAAWYGGGRDGLIVALTSAGVWFISDITSSSYYSSLLVPAWNTLVRLAFFLIILKLLMLVRQKLTIEESLADTDPLTGLSNRRFFQEQLQREYDRLRRYPEPFTIAYFDLDNFKLVNDESGHDEGDILLKAVAQTLSTSIRASDFAARLGGDEFAVMFPFLERESVQSAIDNLHRELLSAMQKGQWQVTFSIGVVTFNDVMDSSRDMIKYVDDLMYRVKRTGKNSIRYRTWPESTA